MGNTNLYQLSEHNMSKKQTYPIRIDEKMTDLPAEAPKPRKAENVYLTNKAGAFANPLAKDFDAWAAIGWYKV
jgi:hypothetical protein